MIFFSFFAQDWFAKSIVNGWNFPWAMEGGFYELSLLGLGDTHDLGVLLYPLVQMYINNESISNSNTLPSQSCVKLLHQRACHLLCESKVNGIGLVYSYLRWRVLLFWQKPCTYSWGFEECR